MTKSISEFFSAWELQDADARLQKIKSSVSADIRYDDPRTPNTVIGIEALSEYVGMFSANAPGWSARVVREDTTAGMVRATVMFGGMGPDGKEMEQAGQYYVELDGDTISRMVGFVGTGNPD